MRQINNLVLHCTATGTDATVSAIKNYWKEHLGWNNPGYHYIIGRNGYRHILLDVNEIANGVAGHNEDSIHISYIGGIDEYGRAFDNRTRDQIQEQETLLRELLMILKEYQNKKPCILGHRDFEGVKKACPSFDARKEFAHLVNDYSYG